MSFNFRVQDKKRNLNQADLTFICTPQEKKSYFKYVQMSTESNLKAKSKVTKYMLFYVFIQLIYSIGDIF